MGLFDFLNKHIDLNELISEVISYGELKKDGSHNHTYNKGKDRTPAQQKADQAKKKTSQFYE